MCRLALFFITVIGVATIATNAERDAKAKSALSILGQEDSREYIYPALDSLDPGESRTNVGGAVLLTIKNQFKEIIRELCFQAFEWAKDIFHHFKIKMLKKLGAYTLKDVFRVIFDGVADFVVESPPAVYYSEENYGPEIPISQVNPSYFDGYGLSSLLRAKKTVY